MADEFIIYLGKHQVKAQVIYQTDQVSRYKLLLGEKHIVLEEHHLKKSAKWKIKDATANVDISKLTSYLSNITSQIERRNEPASGDGYSKKPW